MSCYTSKCYYNKISDHTNVLGTKYNYRTALPNFHVIKDLKVYEVKLNVRFWTLLCTKTYTKYAIYNLQ